MIGMIKRVFDLEKIDIECKQCKSMIDTTYVFCPKC
jgi:Zn finger protein HypA/HybF involved in hydrogenase expression